MGFYWKDYKKEKMINCNCNIMLHTDFTGWILRPNGINGLVGVEKQVIPHFHIPNFNVQFN